jgi:hypothetical protein
LRRADKNPNQKGVREIAQALGVQLGSYEEGIASKVAKILVLGSEAPDGRLGDMLKAAQTSLAFGTHLVPALTQAKVSLLTVHSSMTKVAFSACGPAIP